MEFTEPLEVAAVEAAHMAEMPMPKRVSLPSMLPPGWASLARGDRVDVGPRGRLLGHASGLERVRGDDHADKDDHHHARRWPSPAAYCPPSAEGVGEPRRDEQDRQQFHEVRERRRVLERMRGVGVEEAAAVGAQLLDGHLGCRGPDGDALRGHDVAVRSRSSPAASVACCVSWKVCTTPCESRMTAKTIESGRRI